MKRSYNEKKHKKSLKKTIDIESEFVGKPVGPVKKKDKEPDLTDEIKAFLTSEISLENIMNIIIRMEGLYAKASIGKSKIKIYGLTTEDRSEKYSFIIKIKSPKIFGGTYYLKRMSMYRLDYIFKSKPIDTSLLKQDLRYAIWEWLNAHPDQFIHVD